MLIRNTNNNEGVFLSEYLYEFFEDAYEKNAYCYSEMVTLAVYYFSGRCSFDYNDKIKKKVFNKVSYLLEDDDGNVKTDNNQKMKLGKLILKVSNCLLDNKVSTNDLWMLEKLVDDYKSWIKINKTLKFDIYKGNAILKGYNRRFHKDNNGMLHNSCMNGNPTLLGLYTDNQDKVSLLVLVDDKDKIHGRALLWKLDNRPFMFMDRIYGIDNYINSIFIKYAKKNGFAYRSQNSLFDIFLPDGIIKSNNYKMIVKVKMNHLKNVPYMDTFSIMSLLDSTVRNTYKNKFIIQYKDMQRTNGTLQDWSSTRIAGF